MNADKLKKLQAEVRIGGKGTPRRKKKILKKTAATDDKKLQSSLKKLSVNTIPGIEEVNMIKDDGTVIHFNNPKAQASLAANTFAITGHAENKQIAEMLPGILTQLGPEGLNQLKRLASNVVVGNKLLSSVNEEDDVPNLVENFEDASKKEIESIQKSETPKIEEQKPAADIKSSPIEETTKLVEEKLKIDEKPAVKTEKVEAVKPVAETKPVDTPKTDAPKVETPKTVAPQVEAPKDVTKNAAVAPKAEVTKSDDSKKSAPKKETAKEQTKTDDKKKTESKKPEAKGNKKVDDKNKKNKNQKKDN